MRKVIVPLLLAVAIVAVMFAAAKNGTGNKSPTALGYTKNAKFEQDDYQTIIASQNQLGFDLLPEAARDKHGNLFISPTSLFMALSMVYNGADGITKEEMGKVLHSEGMGPDELNKDNASLMSMLQNDSEHIRLDVANSIWLNNQFHFQKDFSKETRDYFNAKIKEINLADSQSPKLINNWVKEKTNGKIKEIADDPLNPDLVAMLINAIYFKGDWDHPFAPKQTKDRPFHTGDSTTKDVPMMYLKERLDYLETEDFQAVSLPYYGGRMDMKVFLPKEGFRLKEFEQLLTVENWQKWNAQFISNQGAVLLPKFKLEYEAVLNDPLQNLGMSTAFGPGANFANMIQEHDPIWIAKVKQKTYIDVNEKGTEAAAATSVEMEKASTALGDPFYMEVNRPFFFAITNSETGAILFMGAIADL
jgi:serine protease inhibitor